MRFILFKKRLPTILIFLLFQTAVFSQVAYVWNGGTSSSWNVNTNWTPNGVPGALDHVTVTSGANNCVLNTNTQIANLTVSNGILDLGAGVLTATGNLVFTAGSVSNGTLVVNSGTLNSAIFIGTTLNASAFLNVATGAVIISGGIFNGNVSCNQIGAIQTTGLGGATFNGSLLLVNSGTSNIRINGNCTFNGVTTFSNVGTGYFLPELVSGNTYNNTLNLINNSGSNIRMAYLGSTTINGNLVVNNLSTGNIEFCEQASSTCSLTSGNTISVGSNGFTQGRLVLRRFNQLGITTQSVVTTGTSYISITNNCLFNGPLYTTAPSYILSNSIYQAPVYYTKTGSTSDATSGGNVYNSTLTVNHNGTTGYWSFANGSADTYNSDVYSNNNSNDRIIFGHASTGNLFNGDIILTQIGSSQGTALTWNTTSTATLAAGKTISIGAAGYNIGYLYVQGLTQLGSAPVNLNFTGTSSIYLGPNTAIGGSVGVVAPDIYARGASYSGSVVFTKTGGTSNHNNGAQNIFNSTLEVIQQSNTGYFMLGYNSNDLFNDDVIVSSTGSGGINLGWTNGTGNPTLASGRKILIGSAGFGIGYLRLGGFVQLGTTASNLTLTGSASFFIDYTSAPSIFNASLTVTAPDLYIRGGTFNDAVIFTKTGGTSNHNNGVQNVFNSTLEIDQQSSGGYFMLSYNSNDVYNDDIIVSSTGTGGIYFGWPSGTGSPTLTAGNTILVGSGGFSSGFLNLHNFKQLGSAPINLNFTGLSSYITFANNTYIGGNLTATSPGYYFNGATFNGLVNCDKTGSGNYASSGGNTFQAIASFTNSGTGYLLFANGNADVFNADVKYTNVGSSYIYPAYSSSGNLFNGNIEVNSSGSALGIYFCANGAATSTLAANKTMSVNTGYSSGFLTLRNFTQLGNAPISLTLTAPATYIQYGPGSSIGGTLTSQSPGVLFNGCSFSSPVECIKNGTSNDYSPGNNAFYALTSFTNSGSGFLLLGNSSSDLFNDDVKFTNSGSSLIYVAHSSSGNLFNGNIEVNSPGSGTGIVFSQGATASSTLAASKTISVGTIYSSGHLILRNFTQLGSAPVNLSFANTASFIQFGPASTIGGSLTTTSPGLFFNGCKFNDVVNCIKTGSSNDASVGNNIFSSASSFTNAGSGYLLFGNGNGDQFNSTSSFNNTGSSHIYVSYNATGNVFGGAVTLNNSPLTTNSWIYFGNFMANNSIINGNLIVSNINGAGISFGSNSGTSTLSPGFLISIGSGGFNSGQLIFRQFTQAGVAPQSFTTTGTSSVLYGPSSTFNANLASKSPGLFFNGCVFNGIVNCEKSGSTNDNSSGNNIFNATSSFTNSGTGHLLFGNGANDQFNAASSFNNTGSSHIYVAYNSSGNVFGGQVSLSNTPSSISSWIYFGSYAANNSIINGNIVVSNTNGAGISFGSNSGTSTLSPGFAVNIGIGGFNSGQLIFRQFVQSGSTAQNFTTTGTSSVLYGPSSTFNGNVNSASPRLFFQGCTFNGSVSCTKTGTTNDASNGGNLFNGSADIINVGSGNLTLANVSSDTYTNVVFQQNGTGIVYPNYNTNCIYLGDVTVKSTSPTAITFGANTNGIATFGGGVNQSINKIAGSGNPTFTRLIMSKSSNDVTLNTRINISNSLTLSSGLINTSTTNLLNMNNNSITGIGNAMSYVNGPMNYDMAFNGIRTLNLPLGKLPDWRPAILRVSHNNATSYTYNSELFNASANALGWAYPPTLNLVSLVHYYDINRVLTSTGAPASTANLAGTQTLTLFYDSNDGVTNATNLRIAKNTPTASTSWIDIGGVGSANVTGSITSTSSPSLFNSFSRFTLANFIGGDNPLPIELLSFTAESLKSKVNLKWITATEINNDYFVIEKSKNGVDFEDLLIKDAYGNGTSKTMQYYSDFDNDPFNGVNYYRLKQVDINGENSISAIVSVIYMKGGISVYPNAFDEKFTINGGGTAVFDYQLYNALGQLLVSGKALDGEADVYTSGFIEGTYILEITIGDTKERVKLIKY